MMVTDHCAINIGFRRLIEATKTKFANVNKTFEIWSDHMKSRHNNNLKP